MTFLQRPAVWAGALLLALAFGTSAAAQPAADVPPAPTARVTDTADFLSNTAVRTLDAQLAAYERSSGHQVLVWIGQSTGGIPIEDFAVRAFEAWKVGRRGLDDGVVLFIMAEDRRLRIEVGYGLEGDLPDAIAARIINEVIVPRIQQGDRDGAVYAGAAAIVQALGGQLDSSGVPASRSARGRASLTFIELVAGAIGVIIFLIILATNPSLALYLLASLLSGQHRGRSGGGGWHGGGGGGWSGGGGRSGGGGASGSW